MGNAFEMLNMASSHPLFFPPRVQWGEKPPLFYKRLADLLFEKQDKLGIFLHNGLAEMSSVFCDTAQCYHVPARK